MQLRQFFRRFHRHRNKDWRYVRGHKCKCELCQLKRQHSGERRKPSLENDDA